MKKLSILLPLMLCTIGLAGCMFGSAKEPVKLDGGGKPYFITKLDRNGSYLVPDEEGKGTEILQLSYEGFFSKKLKMKYADNERSFELLRLENRVPYFVHSKYGNALFLYDPNKRLSHSGLNFTDLRRDKKAYSDNTQLGFVGEPADPEKVAVVRSALGVGPVVVQHEYYIGEHGRPRDKAVDGDYLVTPKEFNDGLELQEDMEFLVFPNPEAAAENKNGQKVLLKAGLKMQHFRIIKNKYMEELLLEDGRVVRVKVGSLFSEPHPYYIVEGKSALELFKGARAY